MKRSIRICICWTILLCPFLAEASPGPDEQVFGVYMSEPKNICFSSPSEPSGWGDCMKLRDELTISANAKDAQAPMHVELDSVWTNGHSCSFVGDASVDVTGRIVATNRSSPECPISLTKTAEEISLSTPEGCDHRFCGARGMIQGVLRKVTCATPDGARQANEPTAAACPSAIPTPSAD